jgi:hypothetical protein
MQDGDKDASEMARLAALSKVRYPFDHIFSKQIKHYRLV